MLGVLVLAFCFCGMGHYGRALPSRAVVIDPVVAVRSGTDPAATRLFDLHAGTRVEIKGRSQGHLKILFTPDKVGWVPLGGVAPI